MSYTLAVGEFTQKGDQPEGAEYKEQFESVIQEVAGSELALLDSSYRSALQQRLRDDSPFTYEGKVASALKLYKRVGAAASTEDQKIDPVRLEQVERYMPDSPEKAAVHATAVFLLKTQDEPKLDSIPHLRMIGLRGWALGRMENAFTDLNTPQTRRKRR